MNKKQYLLEVKNVPFGGYKVFELNKRKWNSLQKDEDKLINFILKNTDFGGNVQVEFIEYVKGEIDGIEVSGVEYGMVKELFVGRDNVKFKFGKEGCKVGEYYIMWKNENYTLYLSQDCNKAWLFNEQRRVFYELTYEEGKQLFDEFKEIEELERSDND